MGARPAEMQRGPIIPVGYVHLGTFASRCIPLQTSHGFAVHGLQNGTSGTGGLTPSIPRPHTRVGASAGGTPTMTCGDTVGRLLRRPRSSASLSTGSRCGPWRRPASWRHGLLDQRRQPSAVPVTRSNRSVSSCRVPTTSGNTAVTSPRNLGSSSSTAGSITSGPTAPRSHWPNTTGWCKSTCSAAAAGPARSAGRSVGQRPDPRVLRARRGSLPQARRLAERGVRELPARPQAPPAFVRAHTRRRLRPPRAGPSGR